MNAFVSGVSLIFPFFFLLKFLCSQILTAPIICSFSSSGYRAGTMPDISMLFSSSKKPRNVNLMNMYDIQLVFWKIIIVAVKVGVNAMCVRVCAYGCCCYDTYLPLPHVGR